jgi:predicted transcriptional regulator
MIEVETRILSIIKKLQRGNKSQIFRECLHLGIFVSWVKFLKIMQDLQNTGLIKIQKVNHFDFVELTDTGRKFSTNCYFLFQNASEKITKLQN